MHIYIYVCVSVSWVCTMCIYDLIYLLLVTGVTCIRVSHLIVPAQVGRGHDAQLHCHFNLGGNILYSVKWFKGILGLLFQYVHVYIVLETCDIANNI